MDIFLDVLVKLLLSFLPLKLTNITFWHLKDHPKSLIILKIKILSEVWLSKVGFFITLYTQNLLNMCFITMCVFSAAVLSQ